MYYSNVKLLPTQSNIAIMSVGGGYLYIDLEMYNILMRNGIDDATALRAHSYEGQANRKLFADILNVEPLNVIRDYAVLIANDLTDATIEEYIDSVGYLFGRIYVMGKTLEELIDSDLAYTIPKNNEYKYIKTKFFQACLPDLNEDEMIPIKYGFIQPAIMFGNVPNMVATTQNMPMQQTQSYTATSSIPDEFADSSIPVDPKYYDLPLWQALLEQYGVNCYQGFGEITVEGYETMSFNSAEMEAMEAFIRSKGVDPESLNIFTAAIQEAQKEHESQIGTIQQSFDEIVPTTPDSQEEVPEYLKAIIALQDIV